MFRALLALFLLAAADASAGAPLRVAVSELNGPPFVLYDAQRQFVGGLARDMVDALATTLGRQPVYLNTPRGRIEPALRSGELDAACFLAPDWVAEPAALQWSPVLLRIRQVIVSNERVGPVMSADDLRGRRIGTLLNYRYPELQALFDSGAATRVDAPSVGANLVKLRSLRIDAVLDVDLAVRYAIATAGWADELHVSPLWTDDNPVHCAFSAAFATEHPDWRDALQRMVDDGRIDRWIANYVGNRY